MAVEIEGNIAIQQILLWEWYWKWCSVVPLNFLHLIHSISNQSFRLSFSVV